MQIIKNKKLKKIFILNCAVILILLLLAGCAQEAGTEAVAGTESEINSETSNMPDTAANSDISDITDISNFTDITETENQTADTSADIDNGIKDGFSFVYNGATVYMDEPMSQVLADLGNPLLKYESTEGCAFTGKIEIYTYAGIEISTYIKEPSETNDGSQDKSADERVFLISFIDDSVSTAEGIYIGQTVSDMTKIYGAAQEESPGSYYNYIKNGTTLSFDVDGDEIISIAYQLINNT